MKTWLTFLFPFCWCFHQQPNVPLPLMKTVFICLLITTSLFSCKERHDNKGDNVNNAIITFEKLDSIEIDFLGVPVVHDIDPTSRTVLFTDNQPYSEDIFVADFEGNINNSFTKFGDLPDTYGVLFAPLKIIGENEFVAYSMMGFMTYDFSGNFISRIKINEIEPYNFKRGSMGYGMGILGEEFIYIDQGSRKGDYSDLELYKEVTPIISLNPSTGERKPILQIPESSLYRNGKHFFRDAWAPVFEVGDEKLYVVFGIEPVIYVYENKAPFSLISQIPIDLPDYYYNKGSSQYDPGFFKWVMVSGRIENIKKLDQYFIVGYFPGYDHQDQTESFENKSPEENRDFGERMRKKYQHRVAILDSLGNVINDFVPEGMDPRNMIIRDGQLWMMESPDPDVEKEYFRLYRVGLKVD